MRFSLVRDLAAEGVSVAVAWETLGFSRQAYYAWRRRPCSARELDDAQLVNAIRDVHADDPEFRYPASSLGWAVSCSPLACSTEGRRHVGYVVVFDE